MATKNNITIYTIGIGTAGLVRYGVDASGKLNLIENTFADIHFKMIAAMTNGKYYWAKDEQELNRILKIIFQ